MSERKTKPKFSSGDVLGAFVLGIICAIPMIVLVYFVLKEQAEDSARLIVFVAIGACIGAVLSLIAVRVVLSKILSRSDPSLQTVFSEASDSLGALGNGDTKSASKHARQATMDALGLIGWLTARRWITSVFLASVGMFAGAASVYVLLQQNAILGQQSELLEVQEQIFLDQSGLMRDTMLAQDGLRYVPLYSELTRLIGEISAAGASRESLEEYELVDLNDELSNRIVTLTRSFRPYWYFDSYSDYQRRSGPGSSGRVPMVFLSPERGLILRALVENRVAIADSHSADFSYSDMRGLSLFGYHQHGLFSDSGANRYFLALGSCSNAGNYAMQSANFGTSFDGEELPGFSDDEELSGRLFSNDFSMYKISPADGGMRKIRIA